jgi:hypothetical protein
MASRVVHAPLHKNGDPGSHRLSDWLSKMLTSDRNNPRAIREPRRMVYT